MLFICSSELVGQYGGYIFSNFSDKDGLPNSTIRKVIEDKDGYLWVKTWNGICFFDGRTFQNVDLTNEVGASKINQSFYVLADGSIWISNDQNSLLEYSKFQNQYTGNSIDSIGRVSIIGHCQSKTIFQKLEEIEYFYIDSLKQKQAINFQVFKDGKPIKDYSIKKVYQDIILCGYNNQTYTATIEHTTKNLIRINLTKPIFTDNFFLSHEHLFYNAQVLKIEGKELDTLINRKEFNELNIDKPFKFVLNKNNLWFYTKSSQLFVYDLNTGNLLEIPSRLWGHQILSLDKDRSGNIWLSTAKGLIRVEKSNTWNFYQSNNDSSLDERIFMVTKDQNGRVWTGGIDGKVFSYDSNFQLDKILSLPYIKNSSVTRHSGRMFGMSLGKKDDLWVTLKGNYSLFKINTNNFSVQPQTIKPTSELHETQKILRTIFIQDNQSIWLGGNRGLHQYHLDDNSISFFRHEQTIWKIVADKANNFWLGTNCLKEFDPKSKTVKSYYLSPDIPNNSINYVFSLYLEPSGQYLWVGSFGNGLHRFNLETKAFDFAFTEKDGLSDNIVYAIYPDKENRLWLATMDGISCFDKTSNTCTNFGLPMNFEINEINSEASYQDPVSGEILIGGMRGALGFYPDTLISTARNAKLNPVFFHKVKSEGKLLSSSEAINETNRIRLPKGKNQIEFEFVSPNSSLVKIQYRYRLDGIDEEWVYPSKDRRYVSYNNLDEGSYTFQVQSRLFDQQWEKNSKELEINVRHFFWQTAKFNIAVGLLILGIIFYILFLRFKNLILKKNAQQKEIEKQTAILHSLSKQMNPHFLYNALNSINNFILNNDERKANEYLSDFANLMRKILNNSKFEKITLASELECVDLYVKLEMLRLSNGFIFEKELDPDLDINNVFIPSMLIQPFIENSIWHGLRHLNKQGVLKLSIFQEDETIVCHIKDNGVGLTKSNQINGKRLDRTSTGIENVKKRLEILNKIHDGRLGLKIRELISNGVVEGTQVSISIAQTGKNKV